jgi:hypothetical protein
MFRQKRKRSLALRIRTGIYFILFVLLPILWIYSVHNDYYKEVEERDKSRAIINKAPTIGSH